MKITVMLVVGFALFCVIIFSIFAINAALEGKRSCIASSFMLGVAIGLYIILIMLTGNDRQTNAACSGLETDKVYACVEGKLHIVKGQLPRHKCVCLCGN